MFRKNDQHLQWSLFGSIDSLPPKQRQRLESSWAGAFYHEYFCRIDEGPFAVLYSDDEASRPNTPVNVLVSFETLKAGFGWSDEETYDHFCYDVQVRYALGCRDLSEGHFELRTVYNFRRRVAQHMQETGENLFEQAFEQVADEQIAAFELKTNKLRMDSTLIASNNGSFNSPEVDELMRQLRVEQIQSAIRGCKPAEDKLELDDFDWETDDDGQPQVAFFPTRA